MPAAASGPAPTRPAVVFRVTAAVGGASPGPMKTNLKWGVFVIVLGGAVGLGAAAAPTGPDGHARWARGFEKAKMSVIANRLGLTAEQRTKLKAIHTQTAAAVQAIRANSALSAGQKQAQIASARQGAKAQMRAVLTDAQRGQLAFLRSHPRRLNLMAARRLRMGVMANRLGLSPDQRAKIREIAAKTAAAVKPVRHDASLAPEAKRERVRQLVAASRTEIRGVLTPEQQQRLQRMRRRLLAPLGPLG
jgi:Spy/CpxP family protein refolding chaperone